MYLFNEKPKKHEKSAQAYHSEPQSGKMSGLFAEKPVKQFEITIVNSGKTFTVREGENILVAALRQGVMLPYSCKNGTCGSCKGLVENG